MVEFKDSFGNILFAVTDDYTFVIHHFTCLDGKVKDFALFNFNNNDYSRYYFIPANDFNINQFLKYFRKEIISYLRDIKQYLDSKEIEECNLIDIFYNYLTDSEKLYLEI